ncbi:MAG: acyltransferase [Aureliella sp.]
MNARTLRTTEPIVWSAGKHIPELDGVRGLAIVLVTLYRFAKELPDDSLGNGLATACAFGERGVDLFFVLSGFLITGVLLDNRGKRHAIYNFIARRSLRIFPLYFASLAILLSISGFVPGYKGIFQQAEENQLYLWTYLTNVKMALDASWCFGYLDHFWSLAVEEHFYLLWPLAVLSLANRRLLSFTLSLAVICATVRIAFALLSENRVATDVLSIFRFDALLLGGAIAAFVRLDEHRIVQLRNRLKLCFTISLIGVFALSVTGRSIFTIAHSAWAFTWASMLFLVISSGTQDRLAQVFRTNWLRTAGKYSYALYVFQSPLIPLAGPVLGTAALAKSIGETPATLLYIPLMCTLSFAAALLSWHLLEKHMLKLKKYF